MADGHLFGYARVSTADQNLTIQRDKLRAAGVLEPMIFAEKRSGTKRGDREELERALNLIREGDKLVVTRLDRLGRSMRDLANIAHELDSKGANMIVIDQHVDTSTAAGRAFFGMLAVFAQFETDVRRERQREGIEKAKAKGDVYKGRPPSINREAVQKMLEAGHRPTDIACRLNISRGSVYKIRDELPDHAVQ